MSTTAPGRGSLVAAAVAAALARGDCGAVAGDAGRRAQYSADASNYRRIPLAVVFPRERRHILNALTVCRLAVPVTFDFTTEQGTAVFRAFVTDAAKLVTAHGGSLSGQLGVARRIARRTVTALTPAIEAGVPVVGLEPSCTAALRTDLPELLDSDDQGRARALADATVTLAELLVRQAPDWQPPRVAAHSISQPHCQQHATSGFGADSALLQRMGVDNTALASGCCGLAGNFGFERGHYDVSVAAGEQVLLPAVRSAALDTHILADGFSCRTQIAQHTDRTGTHLAQLIARALPKEQICD